MMCIHDLQSHTVERIVDSHCCLLSCRFSVNSVHYREAFAGMCRVQAHRQCTLALAGPQQDQASDNSYRFCLLFLSVLTVSTV